MKKAFFLLMALALVVGLSIPMAMPAAASPDALTVYSDTSVQIVGVYNKAGGISNYVNLSGSPLSAVRAQEPKPYPTGYVTEGTEVTDSVWDTNVNWSFQTNAPTADWIWETERAEGPASYDAANPLYDADAAKYGRVVLFKKTFEIPGNAELATLHITADNAYEFWVNSGTHIRSATAKVAGWETSDLKEANVATTGWQDVGHYNITADLTTGTNTLYILAGNEYFWTDDSNSPVPPTQPNPYAQYNPGAAIFQLDIEYVAAVVELSQICGFKYADWQGAHVPLGNWTITLEKWDSEANVGAGAWEFLDSALTDKNGAYCFDELEAGNYTVSETLKDGWTQVSPAGNAYLVTLPETGGAVSYDFHNTPTQYCFNETAWAAQQNPGETRFVTQGNWGTYVKYQGAGTLAYPAAFPLFAGQTHLAGELLVYNEANTLFVKYVASEEAGDYKADLCGAWVGLTEYHLQAADTLAGFNSVRTYNKKTGAGNPIPGQFAKKGYFDPAEADTGWIAVDISGYTGDIFIAAHAVMKWCGYNCNALAEIESASEQDLDLRGDWTIEVWSNLYSPPYYYHEMTVSGQDEFGSLTGNGAVPLGGPYVHQWVLFNSSISGSIVTLKLDYTDGPLASYYEAYLTGTVDDLVTMHGTWTDNYAGGPDSGTWIATRVP